MKIVAIAPYQGLKEVIQSVAGEIEDIEIKVEIGDLNKGVQIAKEAEKNGADVIISRGGTAELIQNEVRIPVIEIEVSAYDLLRTFTLVKGNSEKKAIVGFKNVIENAMTICSLLDIEISAFTVSKESEVVPKLIELQGQNYHIIVGDTITVRNAEALGMNGLLLTSGRESVLKALEEAVKIKRLYYPLMKEAIIPKAILETTDEAVVVFDKSKSLVFMNNAAKQLESVFASPKFERWINQIYKNGEVKTVIEIDGDIWGMEGSQLNHSKLSFASFRLNLTDAHKRKRIPGLKVITPLHDVTLHSMNWFSAKNSLMKHAIEKAKMFSEQDESVWITGEDGTGKERLAYLMHLGSPKSSYPLMTIDCELIEDWGVLLGKEKRLFYWNENGAIYLKKIDKLPLEIQKRMLNFLTQNEMKTRIIVSSKGDIESRIKKEQFNYELYNKLSQLNLSLPPLRERIEDIEGLTQLFINKYNYDYGKQLAGMRAEALEVLQHHRWSGNVDELMQVMKETVLLAKGPFVEKHEIEGVLTRYHQTNNLDHSLNLTGTLKEIELEIIRKVFEEEEMNHSNTAKRLGINRSTLWRKLKED